MISLDLLKSSEIRKAGDQSNSSRKNVLKLSFPFKNILELIVIGLIVLFEAVQACSILEKSKAPPPKDLKSEIALKILRLKCQ